MCSLLLPVLPTDAASHEITKGEVMSTGRQHRLFFINLCNGACHGEIEAVISACVGAESPTFNSIKVQGACRQEAAALGSTPDIIFLVLRLLSMSWRGKKNLLSSFSPFVTCSAQDPLKKPCVFKRH